ncbi:MAG: hypothetical protein VYE81_02220 [Planctomycetota bacterium]|nr:hypothetical protein [Planctomycetota bacterium]
MAQRLAKDLVLVKIDQDKMAGGQAVAGALRDFQSGGIPWFATIDPARGSLVDEGEGSWSLARAAVLSTSDGPDGNVGCPMTPTERDHFIRTLRQTRAAMSDEDIEFIAAALHEYARETIGERADAD